MTCSGSVVGNTRFHAYLTLNASFKKDTWKQLTIPQHVYSTRCMVGGAWDVSTLVRDSIGVFSASEGNGVGIMSDQTVSRVACV